LLKANERPIKKKDKKVILRQQKKEQWKTNSSSNNKETKCQQEHEAIYMLMDDTDITRLKYSVNAIFNEKLQLNI